MDCLRTQSEEDPSPTGKRWHSKVVQEILQNEKYIGDLTLGESGDGKFWRLDGEEIVRADGKSGQKKTPLLRSGVLPSIVDVDLFNRVQKKIEARRTAGRYGGKKDGYILKDILYCGSCGSPLYGNPNSSKPGTVKRKSGKTIYVCKTAINYGKSCDCGQWSVVESDMLAFLSFYGTQLIDPVALEKSIKEKPVPPLQKQVAQIQRALDELTKKIEKGTENFLMAPRELTAELASKLQAWKTERTSLENELNGVLEPKPELDQIRKLTDLREQLLTLPTTDQDLSIRKDSFRKLMLDCSVRVDVWWKRSSEHRWEVVKVRLQIGQRAIEFSGIAPHFFTLSSLIV
jgi:Recombinase zinc beta ribbon domain/Recombinase